jgi:class 3 adenylate cyclase/predicted ATPase
MFCDLVGSTPLSSRLDPEDLREVIGAYQKCVAETIGRFGGFVAKYMGDGVLAYFGYPQAHEDDAERAVRAGLGLLDAVGRLDVKSVKLQARVGIATGLVVVGDLIGEGSAQEQSVVGETPNLAARLQALATPDQIVIAENTRRQVGNLFEQEDLGEIEVKGLPAAVRAFRVLGESRIGSRFEALRTGETPLVGREEEVELLSRRWAQARAGRGQAVLISSEPGIGKSRLAEAFGLSLGSEPHTRLRFFCSPHHQDSPLFPFIGQLERAAGFERDDVPTVRLVKLETLVATTASAEGDTQLLAEMLSLPLDGRYPALHLTPQRKKERTFEALLRQLTGLATRQPVLFIFEDLHWADPSSREMLDVTVEQIERWPVLLIVTFRSEFQPPWIGLPHVTAWSLRRLARDESDQLVRGLARHAVGLSRQVIDEIVDRTDGVPLFLEELTKAVLENAVIGSIPSASLAVPATLHASLLARLDRLGPIAKEAAQVGAAIGREFSYELLAAVAQHSSAQLQDAIVGLVSAGLLFQRGSVPQATFLFKHAMVQDTAYSMLLRGQRQALHSKIAGILEGHFPDLVETQPQTLAHHFTEAGLLEKAIRYWRLAGQRSAAKWALVEAIGQLRRGLQLIDSLPSPPLERNAQELDLQIELAYALRLAKGYAHPEVPEVLSRARSLILDTGLAATPAHFTVLFALWSAHYTAGKAVIALEQAEEFLAVAQSQTDTGLLCVGHRLLGATQLMTGDFLSALSNLEHAAALYNPEEHHRLALQFGQDIGASAFCSLSLALWHVGYPDQASHAAFEALRHARQSSHVHTLAYALIYTGITAASERCVALTEERTKEALALAEEHGFAQWAAYGQMLEGWVLAQRGQSLSAVEKLRGGLTATRQTGARVWEPFFFGLLTEAFATADKVDEGLRVLSEASVTATSDEKMNDAELRRLRGELLRRSASPDSEISASFQLALATARKQGSRGYELRAATSLARLWGEQGRRPEARDLLAPIYGWFTEGFDTPDLKEAKALLDELV